MGFTTGFTGGVTLTLSLAYLSVLAHQRQREQQGEILRSQALVLQGLIDPFPPLPPPSRSEVAAAQRANAVEVAKDRWNHEVENAVRWVQRTDWVHVREGLEESASRLWNRAFGGSSDAADDVQQKIAPLVKDGAAGLGEASGKIAAAAKGAFEKAKTEGKALINAVAEEGKELVGADDGAVKLSPVEKALGQRFEKPEAKASKTVEEALKERYTPMDKRDNTMLRGL